MRNYGLCDYSKCLKKAIVEIDKCNVFIKYNLFCERIWNKNAAIGQCALFTTKFPSHLISMKITVL